MAQCPWVAADRKRVPGNVSLTTRLRIGVYWDEHGIARPCAILEMIGVDGQHQRLTVIDARTGHPILDPVEAIPVDLE